MKALIHEKKIGMEGLTYRETDTPEPGPGEVRVRLKTAGMNHRDLSILNRHQPDDPACIIGSDGAGVIEAAGTEVTAVSTGDEVIINPGLGWEKNSDAPPEGFEILGVPNDGTFAEQIVIPAANVEPKPKHLSWQEAGVLALPALTAYRVLFTRARVKPGDNVFIPGIGGGVATFLLQFARAAGADVYVTSRSELKRKQALELGAMQAIDSHEDWSEALGGKKMDVVVESIGGATFNKSLSQLRRGGTMVTFGSSTDDNVELNIRPFFYGQYNLLGSTMGSTEELQEMLAFIKKYDIKPVMDQTYPLASYEQAFNRLHQAAQIGNIGFSMT
ncbi:zinc-binding dehydrogenase [Salibacterium qingdaonense]|uniref:Zinc-binding alcohol dehydrogenase/oxidoreductase n=1 Tax=Salibacterium qingdaonense TaxID=266892 RepID=A0A1I4P2L1_9BACI|nr:zinc-binding dehydrogenase [Salibacterium qingdaonense]SFM21767.1 zinc-binding alcohol dehydrogenase/oxidoreductase [Salibacterium qingdaonense]